MTALRHGHGVTCLHAHGWTTAMWCLPCRNHLHNSAPANRPVAEWTEEDFDRYERQADIDLAHSVLAAMEDGAIPISPLLAEFDLATTFSPRLEPGTN